MSIFNIRPKNMQHAKTTLPTIALVSLLILPKASYAETCKIDDARILIDIGHTDLTPGAISARGRTEFSYNLNLSKVLYQSLLSRGFKQVFLNQIAGRENLNNRVARLNAFQPDLVISIHHDSVVSYYQQSWIYNGNKNKFSDNFKGWSLLVSTQGNKSVKSLSLAKKIAEQLLSQGLPFSNHHAEPIKGENRLFVAPSLGIYKYDNLAVLKLSNAPAVLVEAGIIVNRDEEIALSSHERQSAIAGSIANGAYEYCKS